MASLSGLRSLVYVYLGTTSADPAYPSATVNALINAAANTLIADVHQARPDYISTTATINPSVALTRTYVLPGIFAGWLEVRETDATGALLEEVRTEDLPKASFGAFAVSGADGSAVLKTSTAVEAGIPLYLHYRSMPVELAADSDTPSWCPTAYHDLIARLAAIDGFGLGNESAPSSHFLRSTEDRKAQFWAAISRRGVAPTLQR